MFVFLLKEVSTMHEFKVDSSKCTKCGICVKACPVSIIEFGESSYPEMNPKSSPYCVECGHCVLFCPTCANSISFLKGDSLVKVSDLALPSEEAALNLLKTRRSIRRFKQEALPDDVIGEIFDTVKMAPTACNDQPVRWIVSADPEKTKEITNLILCWMRGEIFKDPMSPLSLVGASMIAKAKEGEDGLLRGAPHAALAVVPKSHRWPEDGAIALTYLELAAHSLGVGACWGGFLTMAVRASEDLRKYLGISEKEHICGAQMFGWPVFKPVRQFPQRREINITRL